MQKITDAKFYEYESIQRKPMKYKLLAGIYIVIVVSNTL